MDESEGVNNEIGVKRLIELMKVYITPLQDNFNQSDENFKNIPARNLDHFLLGQPKFCGSVFRKINGNNQDILINKFHMNLNKVV